MTFHTFLIKYGEIGIKGKNRYMFEDALVRQIRFALREADGSFKVYKTRGRIYVDCEGFYDFDEVTGCLQKVFGIVGICPVVRLEDRGFDQLKADVVAYMDELYPDKNITFKVEARRSRKNYPKTSMEINCDLGEAILEAFPQIRVDVHHPDVMLNIEVREDIYVYSRIIPGPGGIALHRRAGCGGLLFRTDALAQSAVDADTRIRYGVTESFIILLHADALLRADRRAGFASAAGAFVVGGVHFRGIRLNFCSKIRYFLQLMVRITDFLWFSADSDRPVAGFGCRFGRAFSFFGRITVAVDR